MVDAVEYRLVKKLGCFSPKELRSKNCRPCKDFFAPERFQHGNNLMERSRDGRKIFSGNMDSDDNDKGFCLFQNLKNVLGIYRQVVGENVSFLGRFRLLYLRVIARCKAKVIDGKIRYAATKIPCDIPRIGPQIGRNAKACRLISITIEDGIGGFHTLRNHSEP